MKSLFITGILGILFLLGFTGCSEVSETASVVATPVVATNITVATPVATSISIATTTTTIVTTTEEKLETTVTSTTEQEIFLAFNPNTYRVHYNTCEYYDSSMERIDGNYIKIGRKCWYCNPEVYFETIYTEPTTATTTVTTTTTTTAEVVAAAEEVTSLTGLTYVKNFSRGTFYAYGGSRTGGSGRTLIDCSYGNGTVKGSIASSYLYNNFGYNYNGSRTMVYLEISGYPSMNGYYYLDDCDAGNSNVIDFFYYYNSNCQFRNQGVVSVSCYIVN